MTTPDLNAAPSAPTLDAQVGELYAELRRLATTHTRREREDHTLSATALVHEAYLRLAKSNPQWENKAHFFGLAANVMRQILIDHALAHRAEKRGGEWLRLTLTTAMPEIDASGGIDAAVDVLDLNSALNQLATLDARQAKVVELRYFAGLSIEETAEALDLSIATIKREWVTAKLFLRRFMIENAMENGHQNN